MLRYLHLNIIVFSFRYLATLYSHPDFPHEAHVSHKIIPEIRSCVEKHWQVHLSPPWSSTYLRKIISKSLNGQPVSFTDFYGYLVGQQLLKGVRFLLLTLYTQCKQLYEKSIWPHLVPIKLLEFNHYWFYGIIFSKLYLNQLKAWYVWYLIFSEIKCNSKHPYVG